MYAVIWVQCALYVIAYILKKLLVLSERSDGSHQPTVTKHTLLHVKATSTTSEELRVFNQLL